LRQFIRLRLTYFAGKVHCILRRAEIFAARGS
jgi:hypothetical protein